MTHIVSQQMCSGVGLQPHPVKERPREQRKGMKELKNRVRILEQQVEVMLQERENYLDCIEEKQRAVLNAQVEIARAREALQARTTELEELRRKAHKEAVWLVKSEWRNKLDELARSNNELLHEVHLRDERIAELQRAVCTAQKEENVNDKLLDNIAALTADLLNREKLMSEKDAVLYSYESRLERAEQAALSTLESKCKAECRVNELLKEREENLRIVEELTARNEELEKYIQNDASPVDVVEELVECVEEIFPIRCEKETKERYTQTKKNNSLLSLLLLRLTASEAQMQMRNKLAKWMSFVIRRKVFKQHLREQQYLSSLSSSSTTEQEEMVKKELNARLWDVEKNVAEVHRQLDAAEEALEEQKAQFEGQKEAWAQREDEMTAIIESFEEQLYVAQRQLLERRMVKLVATSEQTSRSLTPICIDTEPSESSNVVCLNNVTARSETDSLLTRNEIVLSGTSTAEKKEGEEDGTISTVVENLVSHRDGSEAAAVIATLLSLHRQGVEFWRVKSLESEEQAEKAKENVFIFLELLHGSIFPHLLVLHMTQFDLMRKKVNTFLEVLPCRMNDLPTESQRTREAFGAGTRWLLMMRFWYRWRMYVDSIRLAVLKERATRTVASMREQNEQLSRIATRAVGRIKELEGSFPGVSRVEGVSLRPIVIVMLENREKDNFVSKSHANKKKKTWTEEERSAYWREKKNERKLRKKLAMVERRKEQQKEWEGLDKEEQERRRAEAIAVHERRRAAEANQHALCERRLADTSLPVLLFDLSFAWCMTTADCRSTVAQIKIGYSVLRQHTFPLRPVISSICGQETTDTSVHSDILRSLCSFEGFQRYPLPIHEGHWSSLYAKERILFLTADAEDVLERLEPDTVYVVGAFVDHNSRKFLSRDTAKRHGVRMARLPLEESIEVGNRCKVLTVNHMVEVLCRYAECLDWRRAFDVLPIRRVSKTKRERSSVLIGIKSESSVDVNVMSSGEDIDSDDGVKRVM